MCIVNFALGMCQCRYSSQLHTPHERAELGSGYTPLIFDLSRRTSCSPPAPWVGH